MKKIFALFAGLALAAGCFTANAQDHVVWKANTGASTYPYVYPLANATVAANQNGFMFNSTEAGNPLVLPGLKQTNGIFGRYDGLQHGVLGIGRHQSINGTATAFNAPIFLSKYAPAYRLSVIPTIKNQGAYLAGKPFVNYRTVSGDYDNRVQKIEKGRWYQLAVACVPGDGVNHLLEGNTIDNARHVLVMMRDQETGKCYPKVVNRQRAELNSSLWRIEVSTSAGSPLYTFINRETGLPLDLDLRDAIELPNQAQPLADNANVKFRGATQINGANITLTNIASRVNIRVREGVDANDKCVQKWAYRAAPLSYTASGMKTQSIRLYNSYTGDTSFDATFKYTLVASRPNFTPMAGGAALPAGMTAASPAPNGFYAGYPNLAAGDYPYYNVNLVRVKNTQDDFTMLEGAENIADNTNIIEIAPVNPSPIALQSSEFNSVLATRTLNNATLKYNKALALLAANNPIEGKITAEDVNRIATNNFLTAQDAPGMRMNNYNPRDLDEYNYFLKLKSAAGYLRLMEKWGASSSVSLGIVPIEAVNPRPLDTDHRSNFKALYFPGNDSIALKVLDGRRPTTATNNVPRPDGTIGWALPYAPTPVANGNDFIEANILVAYVNNIPVGITAFDAYSMFDMRYGKGATLRVRAFDKYTESLGGNVAQAANQFGVNVPITAWEGAQFRVSARGITVGQTQPRLGFEERPVGEFFANPKLATVPTGLYYLKLANNYTGANNFTTQRVGSYIVGTTNASIATTLPVGDLEKDQIFATMPMTQWVVAQSDNCSANAAISVYNREYIRSLANGKPVNKESAINAMGALVNSGTGANDDIAWGEYLGVTVGGFTYFDKTPYRAVWPYMDDLQLYGYTGSNASGLYTLDFSQAAAVSRLERLSVLNAEILYNFVSVEAESGNNAVEAWDPHCGYLFFNDKQLRDTHYNISAYTSNMNGRRYIDVGDEIDGRPLFLNYANKGGASFQFLSQYYNTNTPTPQATEKYGFQDATVLAKIKNAAGKALPVLERRSYVLKVQDQNQLDNDGLYVAACKNSLGTHAPLAPTYKIVKDDVLKASMLPASLTSPKVANIYFKNVLNYGETGAADDQFEPNARKRYIMIDALSPIYDAAKGVVSYSNLPPVAQGTFNVDFLGRNNDDDFNVYTKTFLNNFRINPFLESTTLKHTGASNWLDTPGVLYMGYAFTNVNATGFIGAYNKLPMREDLSDRNMLAVSVEPVGYRHYKSLSAQKFIGIKTFQSATNKDAGWLFDQHMVSNGTGHKKDASGNYIPEEMHYAGLITNAYHPSQVDHNSTENLPMNYAIQVIKPHAQYGDPLGLNPAVPSVMPSYLLAIQVQDKMGKQVTLPNCDLIDTQKYLVGKLMVSLEDSLIAGAALGKKYQDTSRYKFDGYTRVAFVNFIYFETPRPAAAGGGMQDNLWILKANKSWEDATIKGAANTRILETNPTSTNYHLATVADRVLLDGTHKRSLWMFRMPFFKLSNNPLYADKKDAVLLETQGSDNHLVAPMSASWLKLHNGEIVLAQRNPLQTLNEFVQQAELFNVITEGFENVTYATNAETVVAGVKVVSENGAIRVLGAAGKNVVVTNIIGQVVANINAASNDVTVNAPAGVVVVKVAGEKAVKAVVR